MIKAHTQNKLVLLFASALVTASCLTVSCKKESIVSDLIPAKSVSTIKYCELGSGSNEGLVLHVISVVTNATEIELILKNITIGEETHITKAIYRRIIQVDQHDASEPIIISYYEPYYEKAGIKHSFLRLGSREFKTTRQTIEFLNSIYNQNATGIVDQRTTANKDVEPAPPEGRGEATRP